MLKGDGNEKGKKHFARPVHFFKSLCRCFARRQHETSSELHPLIKTMSHVLSKYFVSCAPFCFFFFHCRSFSPRWSLAFLIFSPPLYNFHVVVPVKFVSFVLYLSFQLFLCYPRKCRLKIRLCCYFFSLWKSEWQCDLPPKRVGS